MSYQWWIIVGLFIWISFFAIFTIVMLWHAEHDFYYRRKTHRPPDN